ncbi:kinase-like protein [Cucurbitaria berberidis CBS 394.84]|uniref:Kinase-like protein n=1 Tax=Cucurbitaria berberidis CBS 394.84 TaxID=1168544 RepID=A0A9P4LAI1_9PLEO|nr:kinase-like protein [Cucurbitaria berberidis CBS 394.84]KAF1847523.1 kinase-like protein [Cucurbitaria berberidis CBS 394.84]
MEDSESSSTDLASSHLPTACPSPAKPDESHAHALSDTTLHSSAHSNATLANAHLSFGPAITPASLPRYHVRAPSTALKLETDLAPFATASPSYTLLNPSTVEGNGGDPLRQSATAPIAIHEGYLRSAWSTASLGSLSPASALSSPALNALGDITPLPSPLVMSDSPGPWQRAVPRPSSRDDSFAMFNKGTLSPSPSFKKKGYQRLKTAALEAAAAASSITQHKNEAARERNRSLSEYVPESLHNIRPRHVTHGNTAAEAVQHLHREEYLATQRGLVPARVPAGLPTPPASNASNRSVTDNEEEDVTEDDKTQYIVVRQGPQKTKKLWRPVRQLGQGTFSKVYLATCEKTSATDPLDEDLLDPRKLVAIKVCEHGPAGGADEERVELSLKREVEMLRSVSHPSLVHLQAFDHDNHQALIVLTYCPGGDLFDVASGHRDTLTVSIVQRVFAEMVSAVRYLHSQFIVHRDIKLENILLNIPVSTVPLLKNPQAHPHAIATLTDLGLSRRIPAPPESPLLTTRCGSEDYAAPEILLGQPYDGRSTDAWALGVLLYALMEGRLPFDPPPGKAASRSRAAHRIARCDWVWVKFGNEDGEWDPEKGVEWAGARECVEGLLKKVSRGRKSLEDIEKVEWVQQGIQVEGGLKKRPEDEVVEDNSPQMPSR